jgi:NADH-quinone oxidoreductase subunit M
MNTILLVLLLVVPLIGAIVGAFMPNGKAARNWALFIALATLGVGIALASKFDLKRDLTTLSPTQVLSDSLQLKWGGGDPNVPGMGAEAIGLGSINFTVQFGMDSVSLWLVLLTVLLQPLAIAASFGSIKDREKEYYAWMNALLVAMLGVFIARDLLLFYIFFELTLVPMFFIIGIWGGPERRYAAGKFFLFTFAGSVFTLAVVIYLGYAAGGFEINQVTRFAQSLSPHIRFWLLLGFLAGFAVKVPLFPVHTWLPLAHTEAPTAGSVILAGVLLKLGTYGLLRLAIPIGLGGADLLQELYSFYLIPGLNWIHITITLAGVLKCIGVFCVVGVIYGALVAWVQQDIKKLVAYSSVSHLGFCVLGLFALNAIGFQGSVLYMVNHGLSTGAMFLVIGMIYDRFHTRSINELSGLARRMPIMSFFFVFFVLSSIGLPGMNGFISEFLTILSAFTSDHLGIAYGSFAALGVILGAVYMLHMTARVIFGPLKAPGINGDGHGAHGHGHGHGHSQADQGQAASPDHDHGSLPVDLSGREIAILVPLAVVVLWIGFYPATMIRSMYGLQQLSYQALPAQTMTPPRAEAAPLNAPVLASAENAAK